MKKEFVLVDKEGNIKFVDETSPEVIKTANHLGVTPEQFLDSQRRGWETERMLSKFRDDKDE